MLVNLTPHVITLYRGDAPDAELLPAPVPARLDVSYRRRPPVVHDQRTWPTVEMVLGQVENLPSESEGRWFVVSPVVQAALPERDDLLVPADLVRDRRGTVIGCRALARTTEAIHHGM